MRRKTVYLAAAWVACLALAGPARAEWVAVYANAEASFYIDPASMRKEGALLKVAGLQDLKQLDVDRAMSRRAQAEYDFVMGLNERVHGLKDPFLG